MKSGDNTGADVAAAFRNVLNPIQIFELTSAGPDDALNLMSKLSPVQCRVLVAGGDGTIGWILNAIVKKNLKVIFRVVNQFLEIRPYIFFVFSLSANSRGCYITNRNWK